MVNLNNVLKSGGNGAANDDWNQDQQQSTNQEKIIQMVPPVDPNDKETLTVVGD